MKKIIVLILVLIFILSTFTFVACRNDIPNWDKYTSGEFGIKNKNNPLVEITFSTGDTVRLELYPDKAPITVQNFIDLAKKGVFNGLTMHRIIKNFMIQGGGYTRDENALHVPKLSGVHNIKGEFAINGIANDVSHLKGVISMARTSVDMDSASSQFFICSVDCTSLDGQYAAFGRVVDEESMNAVEKISMVETGICNLEENGTAYRMSDVPVETINIVKVVVYQK